MRLNQGVIVVTGILVILILALSLTFWVVFPTYKDGSIPTKASWRYFVTVKEDVFKKCVSDSSSWMIVDFGNSNSVVLKPKIDKDTTKFYNVLMGQDSLAVKFVEKFKGQGYKFGVHQEFKNKIPYFTLPIEETMETDNFIKVPVWLMAALIDEKVLDINITLNKSVENKTIKWIIGGAFVLAALAALLWKYKTNTPK